jgi:nitrite reductase/ring-hydroxylating ferredoxin subunit/DMSO/TMAO reductase YedYZ heme-binding membrane subunit
VSATYRAVGWTRSKIIYDAILLTGVALYLLAYMRLGPLLRPIEMQLDGPSHAIRAFGTCAFILLSLVLMIGPLARIDSRFLPLLYNRRHFGVITCTVSAAHIIAVFDWYLAYSPLSPWVAMLVVDASFGSLRGFPYLPFGAAAFVILLLLAVTSHDFWLKFLTPPVWKTLHMSIYAAYALVVAHVAFGALQDARNLGLPLLICGMAACVMALHLAAAMLERRRDAATAGQARADAWVEAGPLARFHEGRGVTVILPGGEAVAVFRHGDQLSAISNLCAHQNGPLAEGRVRNGKVICPWHGYEYCVRSGRAPAPYTEKLATYRVRLEDGAVSVHPVANTPGTDVEPVRIPAQVT